MLIHWGVHSSHQRWLDNVFWIYQGAMFTCCYVLDFKIWTSIPKKNWWMPHASYIFIIDWTFLLRKLYGSFSLTKGSFVFWESHWFSFWSSEDPSFFSWEQTWSWNISLQIIMQNNHAIALELPILCNPITRLWFKFASNTLEDQLSKYFVLIELSIVIILGSIKGKCCFSTLSIQVAK
jgi:hypothetical protein